MSTSRIAEADDGPTARFLGDQATTLDVWVAGSFACRIEAVPQAEESLPCRRARTGGPQSTTRCIRSPPAAKRTTTPPATGSSPSRSKDLRVTPFVCYDLRFADWFWRAATGTDCYVVVANWPAERQTHWADLLRARAIENEAFVVGVNRVGNGRRHRIRRTKRRLRTFRRTSWPKPGSAKRSSPSRSIRIWSLEIRSRFPFLTDR